MEEPGSKRTAGVMGLESIYLYSNNAGTELFIGMNIHPMYVLLGDMAKNRYNVLFV